MDKNLIKYILSTLKRISLCVLILNQALAQDSCSRVANINGQEILIDNTSNQKGEGLRYHLEKDPVAKSYLDIYQKSNKIDFGTTVLGSIGSGMIVGGILTNSSSDNNTRLLLGGVSILIINILISRTLEYRNENNLEKAIEEYNKRNSPKILIQPEANNNKGQVDGLALSMAKTWSF